MEQPTEDGTYLVVLDRNVCRIDTARVAAICLVLAVALLAFTIDRYTGQIADQEITNNEK